MVEGVTKVPSVIDVPLFDGNKAKSPKLSTSGVLYFVLPVQQ
jgi:hypothetical protein